MPQNNANGKQAAVTLPVRTAQETALKTQKTAPTQGAVKVGQSTVLKSPYTGEMPVQGEKQSRVIPSVSDTLIQTAQQRIAEAEQGAKRGDGAFKNLLTKAYEAVFHSTKQIPVEGLQFKGKQYLVDVNNGVPAKVISDVNHAPEKLALLEMLPDIVKNGEFVGSTNGKKKVTRYDHFETPVTISGKPYLVLFETEVYPGANNYKTHRLINMELVQQSGEVTGTPPASPESTTAPIAPIIADNSAGGKRIFLKSTKINSRPSDTDVTAQSRATGESPLGNHVQDAEVSTVPNEKVTKNNPAVNKKTLSWTVEARVLSPCLPVSHQQRYPQDTGYNAGITADPTHNARSVPPQGTFFVPQRRNRVKHTAGWSEFMYSVRMLSDTTKIYNVHRKFIKGSNAVMSTVCVMFICFPVITNYWLSCRG